MVRMRACVCNKNRQIDDDGKKCIASLASFVYIYTRKKGSRLRTPTKKEMSRLDEFVSATHMNKYK